MTIKFDSAGGPDVPSLPASLQELQQRLAQLQDRCAARLDHDPSAFAALELEIHASFRQFADLFSAALLAHAASSKPLTRQAKKK